MPKDNTFSNHAGTVTLDMTAGRWNVTNLFYIGKGDSTTTVYMAGGTLSVDESGSSFLAQLRIGDATTNALSGTVQLTNTPAK